MANYAETSVGSNPVKQSQISSSFKELATALSELDNLTARLAERLTPALRSEPDTPNKQAEDRIGSYSTPIATDLSAQKDLVVNNIRRINRLLSLLEL